MVDGKPMLNCDKLMTREKHLFSFQRFIATKEKQQLQCFILTPLAGRCRILFAFSFWQFDLKALFSFDCDLKLIIFVLFCFAFVLNFAVDLVVYTLPEMYVERLLEFVSKQISTSHHIEFYLSWATKLLTTHASKENVLKQQSLISIQDSLQRKYDSLSKVCDFNKYTLKVLQEVVATNAAADQTSDADDDDDDDDSDNDDRHDLDDGNLMLINSNSNGAHDHDVEMQTDSDSDSDESMDAMSADDT